MLHAPRHQLACPWGRAISARMSRLAKAFPLLILGVALVGCGGDAPPEAASATEATMLSVLERTWTDTTRSTPRTSRFAGAPDRTLRVVMWIPESSQSLPLLVLAHGWGGSPEKFDAFARAAALAGYIVAAPAFPLTNEHAPGGHEAGLADVASQPGDLSFVITKLLDAADTGAAPLAGRVRGAEIAVLGHSLGGVTTLALTRHSCCRDARVRAAILVAAVDGLLPLYFAGPPTNDGPPTLLLHGVADAAVPYSTAFVLYERLSPPRVLVGLAGAGHSDALESHSEPPIASRRAAQTATVGFLEAVLHGAVAPFDAALAGLAAEGHTVLAEGL
jgi:alpha-beta hydrolase superfamily lysophospholipase